ncbi:MAG: hypothetical protein IJ875_05670 [Solobacterium sp.]|nr:hypothetical protein [Solobacterium sp.]
MTYIEQKEIDEALNAANDALYHLGNADEVLRSARNWGIADILGGKMIVTGIKRSKMSEASLHIRNAQEALNILADELQDIGDYFHIDALVDDGLSIADFVFDNFVTDILSQQRINRARSQVKNAIAQVEGILDALSEIAEMNYAQKK